MISQSYFDSPGPSTAFRTRLTRRSPLVNVPSFSAKQVPGRTTSAYSQLSFQKISCMTQKSSLSSMLPDMVRVGVGDHRVQAEEIHCLDRVAALVDLLG